MIHRTGRQRGTVTDPPIPLRALSLRAGVQSTTTPLIAAHGEVGPTIAPSRVKAASCV